MTGIDSRIHLQAEGVSLVLDTNGGRLPSVLHWGEALGPLDAEAYDGLLRAGLPPRLSNGPDDPIRLSLIPEGSSGWMGRPGFSGARADGTGWSPQWRVTAATVDGHPAGGDVRNAGAAAVRYAAIDEVAGLRLDIDVELLPAGLVRARASVTNDGPTDYRVDELLIALPVPTRAREVLDFAGRWSKERTPQRTILGVGQHRREGRHGRTGADSAYVLHLGTEGFGFAQGELWAVHTAWSGNHVHYAERVSAGDQVIGGGELLLPGEGTLAPGASYTGPWLYGSHGVGLDAVARRFHRWLRSRPHHPSVERPVTLNVWEAVYFDHNLERLTGLADIAAGLGVERFVLDDGWFGARRNDLAGLGDWVVSPEVWPNGLHPLVDHVTGLGMQFGLWFEPEMVNPDSDVARAHPEWIMQPGGGRLPVASRHQQVLNLGLPDAYAHVRDQMMALLAEYAISYIKWDHNRDLVEAGTAPGGAAGVHAQTAAFYRLVDELKAAHPGLEIESCSSGGSRVDLEALARCDRVWVSDNIDPEDRQQMNRWTTQLIPPELMGSHIASGRSHVTGRDHTLSFRAGTAVFGHLGIEWDLGRASASELRELRTWIDWWKANRGLLLRGDLVRVDVPGEGTYLHGVATPERGLYSLCATTVQGEANLGQVVLPGLDPDAHYRVAPLGIFGPPRTLPPGDPEAPLPDGVAPWTVTGVTMSGRALARAGVRAPTLNPDQCLLIEARRVSG